MADFIYSPDQLPALLAGLSESDFAAYKKGIISKKMEPDQRLTAQAGRFWSEICQQRGEDEPIFDRSHREVEVLETVSKAEFVAFATDLLDGDGTRLLVSEITSEKMRAQPHKEVPIELQKVDDRFAIAKSLPCL